MEDVRILLSALWIAVVLTYLLGDVLRIFAGDFKPGEIGGRRMSQLQWLGIAGVMVTPILLVFLSLVLPQPISRWGNVIAAVSLFIFNLLGLPTYPSAYDRFLIVVGLGLNAVTVWYALMWV